MVKLPQRGVKANLLQSQHLCHGRSSLWTVPLECFPNGGDEELSAAVRLHDLITEPFGRLSFRHSDYTVDSIPRRASGQKIAVHRLLWSNYTFRSIANDTQKLRPIRARIWGGRNLESLNGTTLADAVEGHSPGRGFTRRSQ